MWFQCLGGAERDRHLGDMRVMTDIKDTDTEEVELVESGKNFKRVREREEV